MLLELALEMFGCEANGGSGAPAALPNNDIIAKDVDVMVVVVVVAAAAVVTLLLNRVGPL